MTGSEQGDTELLGRYREGDAEAFQRLIERYEAPLLRFAGSTLRDEAAAEDIVQETFVRLVRQSPPVGVNGAVGPWLFRVCRNLAYDMLKTERREQRRRERAHPPAAARTPHERSEGRELHALLLRELENLPSKQREVLRMRTIEGMSYRQISEATGLKTGYIGWLVRKGVRHLTDRLAAQDLI